MNLPVIAFEGLDGTGKSFGLNQLKVFYESLEIPVKIVDSIPYNIFKVAHDKQWYSLEHANILYMQYLAYEVNNYYKNIHEDLGKKVILIDRFIPSCFAYNTINDTTYESALKNIMNVLCTQFFKPDVTFIFEVSNEILFERHKITEQPEMVHNVQYMNLVKSRYELFFQKYKKTEQNTSGWNIFMMSGTLKPEVLVQSMIQHIDSVFAKKGTDFSKIMK